MQRNTTNLRLPYGLNLPPANSDLTILIESDIDSYSGRASVVQRFISTEDDPESELSLFITTGGILGCRAWGTRLDMTQAIQSGISMLRIEGNAITLRNGGNTQTGTISTTATQSNTLRIGRGSSVSSSLNGHIKNIRIWHRALADTELP